MTARSAGGASNPPLMSPPSGAGASMVEPTGEPQAAAAEEHREVLERAVHDLKNPLAVLRASLEWLEVELSATGEVGEAVRDASSAARRMVDLVEDLEALGRLEGVLLRRERVDAGALARSVTETCADRALSRGVHLVVTAPSPLVIEGDTVLLGRAFAALVEIGARHAVASSTVDILLRPCTEEAIEIVVQVRDADLPAATAQAARDLPGAGLALVLARRVVRAHGGTLLASQGERGTRLVVRLPRPLTR
jgi:signal transduction histidine kinase